MRLLYNGADMAGRADVKSCVIEMYAEGASDRARLVFADNEGLWGRWSPATSDYLHIEEGAASTGKLHVQKIQPGTGLLSLQAFAAPSSGYVRRSRTWEQVTLHHLIRDIATRNELTAELHNIENYLYSFVTQEDEGDFAFLDYRLMLEGYAFVVYDGKLVVYDKVKAEAAEAVITLGITADVQHEFTGSGGIGWKSCTLEAGAYTGTYTSPELTEGFFAIIPTSINVSSGEEAARFARGYLLSHNEQLRTGWVQQELTTTIAPGGVANIKTDVWPEWDDKVFITQVRHDITRGKTKIFFRCVRAEA